MNKKIISLVSAGLLFALGACSTGGNIPSASINGDISFVKSNSSASKFESVLKKVAPNGENIYIADVGKGQAGASFAISLNLKDGEGFKTKASANGTIYKTTDVTNIRLVLLEDANTAVPTTNTSTVKFDTGIIPLGSFSYTGGILTAVFKDVPASSATNKSYYVAAAVYNGATAGNNLLTRAAGGTIGYTTLPTAPNTDKLIILAGGAPSTAGTSGSYSSVNGGIAVDTNLVVTSLNDIKGNLQLDTIGATVGSQATVVNGSGTPTLPIITQ